MILLFPRKKIWPAWAGEKFFWEVKFSKFFSKKNLVVGQKSKIQRGGQKAFLEGVGSIWTLGGIIKNRNRWGSTPPDTPLAHLWFIYNQSGVSLLVPLPKDRPRDDNRAFRNINFFLRRYYPTIKCVLVFVRICPDAEFKRLNYTKNRLCYNIKTLQIAPFADLLHT